MRNAEIADAFAELADRLALTDMKPFRYMAYRKAEGVFRELGDSVAVLSQEGRLTEIDGIGPAIEEKVAQLLDTGTFPALERAREEVDDTLLALTGLPGVGAATARKVFAATDQEGFDSLLERAAAGTLEVGGGVTKKVVDALAAEAARRAEGGDDTGGASSGVPRDEAGALLPGPWVRRDQAAQLLDALQVLLAETVGDLEPSGSYARGRELVRSVTALGTADDPAAGAAAAADLLGARGWELAMPLDAPVPAKLADVADDVAAVQLVSPAGIPALLVLAPPAVLGRVRHRLHGPAGWTVHEPEPVADGGVPIELRDRVATGALAIGDVPSDLVTAADLRGELHAHSDWSDGRATIIQMAHAARERGDEYFCVTDHSAPYAMVGGLGPERLAAQAEEIVAANEQLAREHETEGAPAFRVLRGSEVEVLADGTLGLPDSALETLDWVVASIHTQQRQSADAILERMRRVIANPLVDAIGHPTSRRLLIRQRTALDIDELIAMCVDAGVALEINANPDRLDLDSEQAARALAAGARLTVNTDAHRTSTLALRDHGIAVARRAGARVGDVVNCLTVDELLASRRRLQR